MDQLEREHGGSLVYVCCACAQQSEIDHNAMVLFNRTCPTHGITWHRLMLTDHDGSMRLAMPLDSERNQPE
jgi:uncharacterized protein YcfL